MRILVIALSGIGDALLFTPALVRVKQEFPDDTIDALVMFKGAKQIYERTGLFNTVIYHDFLKSPKLKSLSFTLSLRGKYDFSINIYPSNRREYNLIQYLIGARKRGAVEYLRGNFKQLGFLNNTTIVEQDTLHNVEENMALVERLFGLESGSIPDLLLPLSKEDTAFVRTFVASHSIMDNELVIGFHAGSAVFKNHINRRWEPEKFAALGKRFIEDNDAKVLVFGGPDESGLKKDIVGQIGSPRAIAVDAPGIPETTALIKRCDLFVTNDSSLMHIASAMKRKIVAVIGPTNINYIHPWHADYEIASLYLDCAPCFIYSPKPLTCSRSDLKYKCIKELTVDMVYSKSMHLLKDPAR